MPALPDLVDALRASVAAAAALGPVRADPAVVAALAPLDSTTLDEAAFTGLLRAAGLADAGGLVLPERMAGVNALLEAAPGPVREALVTAFVDQLSRPEFRALSMSKGPIDEASTRLRQAQPAFGQSRSSSTP